MTVNRESKEKYEGLLKEAVKASKNAYAPYQILRLELHFYQKTERFYRL